MGYHPVAADDGPEKVEPPVAPGCSLLSVIGIEPRTGKYSHARSGLQKVNLKDSPTKLN